MYRGVAGSIEGFVQQLACRYVTDGYYFYIRGTIPSEKDPQLVDQKLIQLYKIDISKWARCRARKAGQASVQYLRYGRTFVLIATHGRHVFFDREGGIKDIREDPIRFHGYSIGCGRGVDGKLHASVRIHRERYRELKTALVSQAVRVSAEELGRKFRALPFEPYARVRRQYLKLLKHVNRARHTAGFEVVPVQVLRFRRRVVRVLENTAG